MNYAKVYQFAKFLMAENNLQNHRLDEVIDPIDFIVEESI